MTDSNFEDMRKMVELRNEIRSMEAAEKMADGQATKIIVPSNLQDVTSLATIVKDMK